jgi:hypothetical protein
MSDSLRSRRSFLKSAAAGAAGLAVSGPAVQSVLGKTSGWTSKMVINPKIPNTRVVCMFDPKMISTPTSSNYTLSGYVAATDATVISTDMDLMAIQLAQKSTAATAWSTIFQKPASKTWAQVMVAIKVNGCNHKNLPRVAVVGKICTVLNGMGVPGANIIVYDGGNSASGGSCNDIAEYTPYFNAAGTGGKYPGITSVNGVGLGGVSSAPVPNNPTGGSTQACPKYIADGTIDILVNIAVNKGHRTPAHNDGNNQGNTGGVTLCLKNHFGTFLASPNHGLTSPTTADNAIYLNMADAIIGGTPPRQQLCIVDSLWADNANNPDGPPKGVVSRLIMGTFAGAVDYLTSLEVKQNIMTNALGWTNTMDFTQINKFMTAFGYTTTDGVWVPITPTTPIPTEIEQGSSVGQHQFRTFEIQLAGQRGSAAMSRFGLPPETSGAVEVQIFDVRGRSIRKMSTRIQGSRTALSWDGKNGLGDKVAAGVYQVHVSTAHYNVIGKIIAE